MSSVVKDDPYGEIKKRPEPASPREVNAFHARSDKDTGAFAQHHTLGIGHNQASPGDHVHDGESSRKVGLGKELTVTTSSGTDAAKLASLITMLHNVIDFTEV